MLFIAIIYKPFIIISHYVIIKYINYETFEIKFSLFIIWYFFYNLVKQEDIFITGLMSIKIKTY